MSGEMRPRKSAFSRQSLSSGGMRKSFHASQKDNSVRQKHRVLLNDYTDQSHQSDPDTIAEAIAITPEVKKVKEKKQKQKRRFGRKKEDQ